MPQLTTAEAVKIIQSLPPHVEFEVWFEKRTRPHELRHMKCRYGVASEKGGEAAYDFEEKQLLCVFDTEKNEYRTVNVAPGALKKFYLIPGTFEVTD